MANYLATNTDLEAIADAIREKGGTSADLVFPQGFVDAIDAIETGGGSSFPKTTYIHAESWQTSDKGNAATFVSTYFSGFTEAGIYVAITSNNSNTSQYRAIAALMWKTIGSDGKNMAIW